MTTLVKDRPSVAGRKVDGAVHSGIALANVVGFANQQTSFSIGQSKIDRQNIRRGALQGWHVGAYPHWEFHGPIIPTGNPVIAPALDGIKFGLWPGSSPGSGIRTAGFALHERPKGDATADRYHEVVLLENSEIRVITGRDSDALSYLPIKFGEKNAAGTFTERAAITTTGVTLANPLPIGSGGTGQSTATAAFNALDPLTTKGDLIVHDGTDSVRKAVGSNGQVLTADSAESTGVKWATPTGTTPWTTVKKTTTQTKTSDTTLAADDILKFTMSASTKYAFKLVVFTDSPSTADFKYRHVGPAAPDLVQIERRQIAPAAASYSNIRIDSAYSAADLLMLDAGGTAGYIEMNGTIHNGVNAGDFEFHWAQNTSDTGNTKVLAGSYLEWMAL